LKNKLHIPKSELPEDGQQLRPKDVGGLTNKSFVQQDGVKFYICLKEVYVIKDNINAFNKTLNKPSKAVPPCWTHIMRFCPFSVNLSMAFSVSTLKGNNNPTTTYDNNTKHLNLHTYNHLQHFVNKQLLTCVQLIYN